MAGTTIAVTYHDEWQDGLGARGWKMDGAIGDPAVIAVTAYTGDKLPTSVLIHDLLDHCVGGFGPSGHRNEAMATMQLRLRTGVEIDSSYAQQAEDILRSGVNGEPLRQFLPTALRHHLPDNSASDRELLNLLIQRLGRTALKQDLIEHLWTLGRQGQPRALASWHRHGLEYTRRSAIGMCLQHLLEQGEQHILEQRPSSAHGHFTLGNRSCAFRITTDSDQATTVALQADVDIASYPAPDAFALTARAGSN